MGHGFIPLHGKFISTSALHRTLINLSATVNPTLSLWMFSPHKSIFNCSQSADDMIEGQQMISIDTGELVWAVAFGCGTATTQANSINLNWSQKHWRYKIPKNLILATGLNSGRIRTWSVRTGNSTRWPRPDRLLNNVH